MPTATARRAALRDSSSSRPIRTISCSRSAIQASLVPKPARWALLDTESGMCASSNCRSVRTSTSSAPSRRLPSIWRGVSGGSSTPAVTSGPLLSATMLSKLGGCGPSAPIASSTNASSSSIVEQVVVARLEADRRRHLHVHAGAAAQRSAQVAGPHLGVVRAASAAGRAASGRSGARPRSCRRPGRGVPRRRRTASRRSGRPTARRRVRCRSARTRCARDGAPGCGSPGSARRPARAPSRRRTARARSRAALRSCTWMVAPVASTRRPCPLTWSAWLWVSRTCSISTPR